MSARGFVAVAHELSREASRLETQSLLSFRRISAPVARAAAAKRQLARMLRMRELDRQACVGLRVSRE